MEWPLLNSERIAIFSNVPLWINRHPEALEIAWRYRLLNRINWIFCDGSLATCPANSFHDRSVCSLCIKQTEYTNTELLPREVHVHRYEPVGVELDINDLPTNLLELIEFRYLSVPIGGMVVSQLADDLRDRNFDWEPIKNRALALLVSGIELYEWSRNFFVSHAITTAFIWNGRRPCDGPMAFAARNLGLRYYTFISDEQGKVRLVPDVSVQSSAGLMQALSVVRDRDLSPSEIRSASDLVERFRYGSDSDRTLPWFARKQTRTFGRPGSKPLLALFTTSPFECIGLEQFSVENDLKQNLSENVLEDICSRSSITSNWEVVIRFHPNLVDAGPYERARIQRLGEDFPSVTVVRPEDKVSSYDILEQASVVVTFGSTIGVEASWYGKPSLLIGRAPHEQAEVCTPVCTVDELEAFLRKGEYKTISKLRVIEYLVAERSTHLSMTHVKVSQTKSKLSGMRLERPSFQNQLMVYGRQFLNLIFRLQRMVRRWRELAIRRTA